MTPTRPVAFVCSLLLALSACASPPKSATYPEAQHIVDQVAGRNPDVTRLTIHAVASGDTKSRVIASTAAARLNTWSDSEDSEAMDTGKPVTLKEGADLDYTAPVVDTKGKAVAAVGVTVKGGAGVAEDAQLAKAKQIAAEVSSAILAVSKPMW